MALFESYERRIKQITEVLNKYGIKDLEEAKKICEEKGINPYVLKMLVGHIQLEQQ